MAQNAKGKPTAPRKSHSSPIRLLSLGAITVLLIAVIAILVNVDQHLEDYALFDPKDLQAIAHRAINAHGAGVGNGNYSDGNLSKVMDAIIVDLEQKYGPNHINRDPEWVFNNAGGAMGAMHILHASVTEYLIIFGTPLGTEGHTGRFLADDWFCILQGEQWAFSPGGLEKEVYLPGDSHHLARGKAKQYKMHEGCFALEYARGWIPSMMFFGFADTFSSTLDFETLYVTIKLTVMGIFKELTQGKF
ncbi:unnamed protein product [Calypogeia fissa]